MPLQTAILEEMPRQTTIFLAAALVTLLFVDSLAQVYQPFAYGLTVLLMGIGAWPLTRDQKWPGFLMDKAGQASLGKFSMFWGTWAMTAWVCSGYVVYH